MRKGLKPYRYAALPVCFALLQVCAVAQDLGSSNKLFNPPNPKTKTTSKMTTKKAALKSKESKTGSRKNAAKSKSEARSAALTGGINKSKRAIAGKDTRDVLAMIRVADVMQSQQRYAESEQLLRRALLQDPKNLTALILLGRALTARKSYDEAEQVLKTSVEVSPNSFVSYVLLGSLYEQRENFNEAENYLMKALKLVTPNEKKRLAGEFEAVGDGFLLAGKNSDAARVYRQAAALDKDRTSLAARLAKTQMN